MAEREPLPGHALYAVLGLTPEATGEEIRAAYQGLLGEIAAGQLSAVEPREIEAAFEILGDPMRRLRYDAQASEPPPPRFQLPALRMRQLSGRRPTLPRVNPVLVAVIGLLGLAVLMVVWLPLLRGRGNITKPAQSGSDFVSSSTPTSVSQPTQPALLAGAPGGTGTSVAPSPASSGLPRVPPFLTSSAIIDTLRAVAAASVVRNGPQQASVAQPSPVLQQNQPPTGTPITSIGVPTVVSTAQPNAGSGGPFASPPAAASASATPPSAASPAPPAVPVASNGALPPVVRADQPSAGSGGPFASPPAAASAFATPPSTAAPTLTPMPTPRPAPNHIVVPTGPITPSGAATTAGPTRAAAGATAGPNRIVPASTATR